MFLISSIYVTCPVHLSPDLIVQLILYTNKTTGMIHLPQQTNLKFNEVFLGYQLGKVVQVCRDQRFEDHLCPHPQSC